MPTMVLGNRVLVQTTQVGTANYQLGAALTGFLTFGGGGVATGKRVPYLAVDSLTAPTIWEIGEGVFSTGSPDTLTRATIVASSAGVSAIAWGAGTKYIACVPNQAASLLREAEGNAALVGTYQMGQLYAYGANVGTLVTNETLVARVRADTSQTDELQMAFTRFTAGSDSAGVAARLRRVIAGSQTGAMELYANGDIQLTPLSTSNTVILGGRSYIVGTLRLGQNTVDNPGGGNTTQGVAVTSGGQVFASVAASAANTANRNSDGIINDFFRSGAFVGSISVTTTATAFNTTSDRALKDRIAPLTAAQAHVILDGLSAYMHGFKAEPEAPLVLGFMADEHRAVLPQAVFGEPGSMAVDYSKCTPALARVLQDLRDRIESMEARLAALEA